ncbi:hypothetical protein [uncultured Tateyamaria sp.]|uniref:hypothetical protein n=1 Tax=uncultured Tateyamaria sp. TaxID=455651 RepID=UPI002609CAAD|nr:hypothetical protein [uncultured Tateyamaria sp.]
MRLIWSALLVLAIPASAGYAQTTATDCAPDRVVLPHEVDFVVSLAAVQSNLERCQGLADCGEDARRLFGLKRVDGFVLDPAGDILFVGRKGAGLGPLDFDDFVVMLRHAMHEYAPVTHHIDAQGRRVATRTLTAPGVTIDPRPESIAALNRLVENTTLAQYAQDWPLICQTPMDAKTLGIPHGTGPSAKMMFADAMLKTISNGLSPVPDLPSVHDRNLTRFLQDGTPSSGSMTRYWFSAGLHDILEDNGDYLFRRANVALLDEAEHLTSAGEFAATGQTNPVARAFSCDMTRQFPDLMDQPDLGYLKDLDDVFRWGLVAQLLVSSDAFARTGFDTTWLLKQAPVRLYDVPHEFTGVSRIYRWPQDAPADLARKGREGLHVVFASCGGVSVDLRETVKTVRRDANGRVAHLSRTVLLQRPAPTARSWRVKVGP